MRKPPTDNHGEDWGRLEEKVDGIAEAVKCLPELCDTISRHDEKIKTLRTDHDSLVFRVWWIVGIGLPMILGIIGLVLAQRR